MFRKIYYLLLWQSYNNYLVLHMFYLYNLGLLVFLSQTNKVPPIY
mgnify:CR=1 FL=1